MRLSITDWQNVGAFSYRSGERILRVNIIAQSAFVRNAVFVLLVELRLQGIQALLRVVRGNYVRTGVNELVNGLAVQNLNHGLNSLVAHLVSHLGNRHRHLSRPGLLHKQRGHH